MQQQVAHIEPEPAFKWVELLLNWSVEIGVAVAVPITVAYTYSKRNKGDK